MQLVPKSFRPTIFVPKICAWLFLLIFFPGALHAATYTVTSNEDTGAQGTLRWAITEANANPGSTINFDGSVGTIILTSALPIITTGMTINGGVGTTISGNQLYRAFFVNTANSTDAVNFNNLTIADGYAHGGNGGASGGGGLGAGAAIFVNTGAVRVSNITLSGNMAQGGQGGIGNSLNFSRPDDRRAAGGGGGLGGNGGDGTDGNGGGGGGYSGDGGSNLYRKAGNAIGGGGGGGGIVGDGGNSLGNDGNISGGGGGGTTDAGTSPTPGTQGGAGASQSQTSGGGSDGGVGGGGGGGNVLGATNGGDGGLYGGGGGSSVYIIGTGRTFLSGYGGNGGDFGGGGGSGGNGNGVIKAGDGGFGGGGGGGGNISSSSTNVLGGNGGFGGGGGGAKNVAGVGGLYGGSGGTNINGNPGAGGGGAALGGAIFVRSENGASLTFAGTEFNSSVIGGSAGANPPQPSHAIVTLATNGQALGSAMFLGLGDTTFEAGMVNGNITGVTGASLLKTTSGTLVLNGANTYNGGTKIANGTLHVGSAGALGDAGPITFQGGTLQFSAANTTDYSSRFFNGAYGTQYRIDTNGQDVTFASNLNAGGGELYKSGEGTLTLTGDNVFAGGVYLTGGALTAGSESALGPGTGMTFAGGTLRYVSTNLTDYSGRFSNTANASFRIDTNGQSVNFASGLNSLGGTLAKLGSGTLSLNAGLNSYTGATAVSEGTLRISGTVSSNAFSIASGAILELNVANGSRDATALTAANTFTGGGTLRKTGDGSIRWGGGTGIFQMDAGSLIDVQAGDFYGGSNANEVWTANQSALHVAAGANFYGVEANVRVDALSGAGRITSGFSGPTYQGFTFGVAGGSGTFSGVLADHPGFTGNFIKSGTGTQILTGANTYTGTTSVSGGILQIGNGGTTGSLASNAIVNNAALVFNHDGTSAYAGAISGTGTLQKSGAGLLSLSGSNSYSGITTVSAGTLRLQNTTVSPAFSIASGAALDYSVTTNSGTQSANTVFTGSGTLIKSGTGGIIWAGSAATFALSKGSLIDVQAGTFTGGSNGNEVWTTNQSSLNVAAGAHFGAVEANVRVDALTGSGTISSGFNGSNTFTFGVADGSGTFAGILANNPLGGGLGNYAKAGTGTQILTGANTYTGTTTVSGGVLQIGNGGATGSLASSAIVNNAALVFNRDGSSAYAGAISGTGALQKSGAGLLSLSGSNSYSGVTTVSAGTLRLQDTTVSPAFSIASGAALDYSVTTNSGTQSANTVFTGSGTLIKSGTGGIIWAGSAATFALSKGSLIDVQAGTFTGGSNGNEVWTGNQSGLNVAAGAHFSAVEANVRVDALTGSGTISSGFNGSNTFTFGVADGSGTFAGVLANNPLGGGLGNFTKTGTGAQILTGANTYTGTTTVSGGSLQIGNGGATGSLVSSALVNNASLIFNRSDASSFAGNISGTGALTKSGLGALTLSSTNTYTGGTIVSSGTLIGNSSSLRGAIANHATTVFNQTTTGTYSGIMSGTGTLAKTGAATLVVTASNSYTGGTTISSGTLAARHSNALGTGAIVVDGGIFFVENGVTIGNEITLSGGGYTRVLNGSLAHAIDSQSHFTGGRPDTAAQILGGVLSTTGTLSSSFANTSSALNDQIRLSDVYSLHGTGSDTFVLQLSLSSLAPGSVLGWLDENNQWVNAVDGNTGVNTIQFIDGAYDGNLVLGHYGVDIATGTAWAVVNHNSDFAIIPEPSTVVLLGVSLLSFAISRRRAAHA
jgi:autotransporter-associated beta strand protein